MVPLSIFWKERGLFALFDAFLLFPFQLPKALLRGGQLFGDGATKLLDRLPDFAPGLIMDLVGLFAIACFVAL